VKIGETMIKEDVKQRVKDAAVIEKIIGERITLKKTGVNFIGKCPFHKEKTESFTVSPSKGTFRCYGCGRYGDVIDFMQEYEAVTFPVALKMLASIYNIDVPDREMTEAEQTAFKQRENAIQALSKQNEGFRENLKKNVKALAFLTETRGISTTMIEKWSLGYATSGFFAGRITYPIRNVAGEIYGFTGRRVNEELQPKFKNSPDSDLFKKSELLFGLHYAKRSISTEDKAYLVEGQHDVLSMDEIGLSNTIAPSGTAITEEHIRRIKRFTNNIVLILDGDAPGLKAAIRNITPLLSEQINLRLIILPEGHDPDSFIRRGDFKGEDINEGGMISPKQYIQDHEINFIEFKALQFRDEMEKDPTVKGKLLNEITNDISIIEDKNTRLAYTQACSAIFGIQEAELSKDIRGLREKLDVKPEEGKWFAFEEAKEKIKELKEVNILSEFDKVVKNHLNNEKNCIGMNCSPLEKNEILKLKKLTTTIVFDEFVHEAFEKKTKQETATVRALKRLISFGFDIKMREGTEIKYNDETNEAYAISYINFTDWYINRITDLLSQADDVFTSYAIEQIAELLSYLPESSRMTKLGNVQARFKERHVKLIIGDFKKIMGTFMRKNAKTFEPNLQVEYSAGDNPLNLNQEQLNDLNRYSHFFRDHSMHHIGKMGHITKVSNFTIIPIIHSNTSFGHFKLFEMANEEGHTVNISLDTKDLNDVRRFKCACEEKGNFVFKGAQTELDDIKERLYANTTYSAEIEQLGWQSEGFWAWADGVTTMNGQFTKTDPNGLITVGEKNYLIKAYSAIYAHEKTVLLNEKKFLHLTSDMTFKEWSSRYKVVFGDNTMICICFLITSFYSDAIFKLVHGELPLLNFFGPKGTGKTQVADSLLAFFGEKQPVNNLSKVTIYGLSQTLKSFYNSLCLIDEYKNILDMKFIEMLKSIYNRQAKIQGAMGNAGTKTEHIPINQMALLCGQDLPTLDAALLERCLCLTSYKSDYTDEQKNKYNDLKNIEEKGLAHLTDDFIKYRELVIEKFAESNNAIQSKISALCPHVSVRLQKNLSTILTAFDILKDKFEFPFTFEQVLNHGISIIEEQQKFIESSDDLKNWWTIFATLIEQKKLKEGRNYVLGDVCQMRYVENDELITYPKGMKCLFIRWDGIYPMYAQYARMSNMIALGEKTIQFYLEKTKYYEGKIKAKRFHDHDTKETWNHQAWCFDYAKMEVNLIESTSLEFDNEDLRPNLNNPVIAKSEEDEKETARLKKEAEDLKKAGDDLPF
jgi:DNA primase